MENLYIIILWIIGIILVAVGWYVPGASGFQILGFLTMAFGAALAFLKRG